MQFKLRKSQEPCIGIFQVEVCSDIQYTIKQYSKRIIHSFAGHEVHLGVVDASGSQSVKKDDYEHLWFPGSA